MSGSTTLRVLKAIARLMAAMFWDNTPRATRNINLVALAQVGIASVFLLAHLPILSFLNVLFSLFWLGFILTRSGHIKKQRKANRQLEAAKVQRRSQLKGWMQYHQGASRDYTALNKLGVFCEPYHITTQPSALVHPMEDPSDEQVEILEAYRHDVKPFVEALSKNLISPQTREAAEAALNRRAADCQRQLQVYHDQMRRIADIEAQTAIEIAEAKYFRSIN